MNTKTPVIVFGDSTIAVFLVAQLLKRDEAVIWATGSGSKLAPLMPYLKSEQALGAMLDSYSVLSGDVYAQPVEKGSFHRVFRNKGFKKAIYKPSFEESVWSPEQQTLGEVELRVRGLTPAMAEEQLRAHFESHPGITRVPSVPVLELEVYEQGGEIQFANGFKTKFSKFFFCDHSQELKHLPKIAMVMKHQVHAIKANHRISALQVLFTHKEEMPYPLDTGFVIPVNRDAGETFDRDVMGYFVDPKRSLWTIFMNADEVEENHEIMKKLRKIKQSLNRAFDAETDATEFMKSVEKEQVRFEPGYVVVDTKTKHSEVNADFALMSDSFGLSHSLETMGSYFNIPAIEFDPLYVPVNAADEGMVDLAGIEMPQHLKPGAVSNLNP